ncbi:hypothetical protein SFUMM280S_03724 [Streptomyces fumanus]
MTPMRKGLSRGVAHRRGAGPGRHEGGDGPGAQGRQASTRRAGWPGTTQRLPTGWASARSRPPRAPPRATASGALGAAAAGRPPRRTEWRRAELVRGARRGRVRRARPPARPGRPEDAPPAEAQASRPPGIHGRRRPVSVNLRDVPSVAGGTWASQPPWDWQRLRGGRLEGVSRQQPRCRGSAASPPARVAELVQGERAAVRLERRGRGQLSRPRGDSRCCGVCARRLLLSSVSGGGLEEVSGDLGGGFS